MINGKPKYDYFLLHATGQSTDKINEYTKGGTVELLPLEQAKEKYLGDKGFLAGRVNETEFAKIYKTAEEGYKFYKAGKFNGYVADKWMYADPDRIVQDNEHAIFANADAQGLTIQPRPGFDEHGRRIESDERMAELYGRVIGKDGKEKAYESPNFLQGFLSLVPTPGVRDITVLDFKKDGTPIFRETTSLDPDVMRQSIIGAWGAAPLEENLLATGLKAAYNGIIPGAVSALGTGAELADNLFDLFVYGEDMPGTFETAGKNIQNVAGSMMIKPSMEASQDAFENVASTVNAIGQVAAQLFTVQLAQLGIRAAIKGSTALMENIITSYSVFGALAADGYNQSAKANGIPPLDIAWQAPIVGTIEAATETFLGPRIISRGINPYLFRKGLNDVIATDMAAGIKEAGINVAKMTPAEGAGLVRRISSTVSQWYSEVLKNPSTKLGRLASVAFEEAEEEAVANPLQNMVMTINDYIAVNKDPNAAPGKGMFGEYNPSLSLAENIAKRAPEGLWQGYVLGFFGGAMGGLTTLRKRAQERTMDQYAAEGKEKEFYSAVDKYVKAKVLQYDHIDGEGNAITSDKEGQVPSLNDIAGQQIKEKMRVLVEVRDAYGIRSPAVLKAIADDTDFLGEALGYAKELHTAQQKVAELSSKETLNDVEAKELAELNRTGEVGQGGVIQSARENLNDIILPEQGSDYSKAYNEKMKNEFIRIKLVEDIIKKKYADQGKPVPETTTQEYAKEFFSNIPQVFNKKMIGVLEDVYTGIQRTEESLKEYKILREAETAKKKALSSDNTTKINDLLGNIKSMTATKENLSSIQTQVGKLAQEINSLISGIENGPSLDAMKQNAQESLNTALEGINELVDMDLAGSVQGTPTSEQTQAQQINDAITGINDQISGIGNTKGIDIDENYEDGFYYKDFEKQVAELKAMATNNFAEKDAVKLKDEVNRMIGIIGVLQNTLNGKEALKDEKISPHLSVDDKPMDPILSAKALESLKGSLQALLGRPGAVDTEEDYEGLYSKIDKAAGLQGNYMDRRRLIESNLTLWSFKKIATTFHDAKFRELIDSIVEFKKDVIDSDTGYTDVTIGKLTLNEDKILKVKKILFDNKAKILTKGSIDKLYEGVTIYGDGYVSNPLNKEKDFVAGLSVINEMTLMTKNEGRNYMISLLATTMSADPMLVEIARTEYLEDPKNAGDKLSTFEQRQAINQVVSFMVNDEDSLEDLKRLILEAEISHYDKTKTPEAYREKQKKFRSSILFVIGEYRSGKTKQIVAEAVKILSYYPGAKKNITVVGISSLNIKDLQEAIPGIKTPYTTDQFFGDKKKEITAHDVIIWDEASLLTNIAATQIIDALKGTKARIILMGDDSQMHPKGQGRTEAYMLGYRTVKVVKKYSSEIALIDDIAYSFKVTSTLSKYSELPNVFSQKNGDEQIGARYYKSREEIVEAFKNSTSTNKALVIMDNNEDGDVLLRRYGLDKSDPNIFKVTKDVMIADLENEPRSIQGQRYRETYVAIDYSNTEGDSQHIGKAIYTAVGRASNFVAVVGPEVKNMLSPEQVNWVEPGTQPVEDADVIKKARERLVAELKSSIVYPDNYKKKDEPEASKTPKTATKEDTRELPVTSQPPINEFTNTLDSPTYKITGGAKVNIGKFFVATEILKDGRLKGYRYDTMKDVDGTTHAIGTHSLEDLEYTSDEDSVRYEVKTPAKETPTATTTEPKTEEPTDSTPPKYSRGAREWIKNRAIYSTTFTTVGNQEYTGKYSEEERVHANVFLSKMIGQYFNSKFVYISTIDTKGSHASDILALKIEIKSVAMRRQFEKILKDSEVPVIVREILTGRDLEGSGLEYVMQLARAESGYPTETEGEREYKHITDYSKSKEDLFAMIDKGFNDTDNEYNEGLRSLNKYIVSMIKDAQEKSRTSTKNEVTINSEPILDNISKYKSQAPHDNSGSKTLSEFISDWEARGFVFDEVIISNHKDEHGKPKKAVFFGMGEVSTDGSYISLRGRKLKEIDTKNYLQSQIEADVLRNAGWDVTNKDNDLRKVQFNQYMNAAWMKRFILANASQIYNKEKGFDKLVDFLNKYGSYNITEKYYSFKERSFDKILRGVAKSDTKKGSPAVYETMFKEFIKNYDELGAGELEIPFNTAGLDKINISSMNGLPSEEQLVVMHSRLNYPYASVVFKEPTVIDKTDKAARKKNIRDARELSEEDSSSYTKYLSLKEAETLLSSMFHPSVWAQIAVDGIVQDLTMNSKRLSGLMMNGKMYLNLYKLGIKKPTLRHEAFHLVFNYMIDQKSRDLLFSESKIAMRNSGYKGAINNLQAEEWMARKFGETEDLKPWYTPKGILQRFKAFMNKMFGMFQSFSPAIDDLFYQINNGKFQDTKVPAYASEDEVMRTDEEDMTEDIEEQEDDTPDAKLYSRAWVKTVPRLFPRSHTIQSIKRIIGSDLNTLTNLHNATVDTDGNIDWGRSIEAFPEAYASLEKQYINEENRMLGERETPYGQIKTITGETSQKLTDEEWEIYLDYNLSDEVVFRSFIKSIFKGMNFDKKSIEKTSVSTQYKSKGDVNPEQGKTAFLKWQIDITPKYRFDKNNKIIGESNGYVDTDDVNIALIAAGEIVARKSKYENIDTFKEFKDALFEIADKVRTENARRNNVLSVLHKFFSSMDDTQVDFQTMVDILMNSDQEAMKARGMEINAFLVGMVNYYKDLESPGHVYVKVSRNRDEVSYKVVNQSVVDEDIEKAKIIERIYGDVFEYGMVKGFVKDAIGLGDEKKQIFKVTKDGLFWTKGLKKDEAPSPIIRITKNGIEFTKLFDNQNIRKNVINIIGLGYVGKTTISDMYKNESLGIREIMERDSPYKGKIESKEFLAELLMNMYWSTHTNAEASAKANKILQRIREKETDDTLTTAGKKKEISALNKEMNSLAKTGFYEQMKSFRKDNTVKNSNMDGQYGEADTEKVTLPKPTDYFKAFTALGSISLHNKGLGANRFHNTPDKKRVFNIKQSSSNSRLFKYGSEVIRKEFDRKLKEGLIDPTAHEWHDGKQALNMLLKENGIVMEEQRTVTGMTADFKGRGKLVEADLHAALFNVWLDGIKRSYGLRIQKNIFGSTILADKSKTELNTFNFSPRIGEFVYLSYTMDDGKMIDPKINETIINKSIATEFHRQAHAHDNSRKRWMKFAAKSSIELPEFVVTGKFDPSDQGIRDTMIKIEASKVQEFTSSGLYETKDYHVRQRHDDGSITVQLGNNTVWHHLGSVDIYNHDNFVKFSKKGQFSITTAERDALFGSEFKDFARKMKEIGYHMPDEFNTLLSNRGYYITDNGEYTGTVTEMNPIMKAYFYGYHIANTAYSNIAYGTVEDLDGVMTKTKRAASDHTPMSSIDLSQKYGLLAESQEIVVEDMMVTDPNTGEKIRVADGEAWFGMLYDQFLQVSTGGFSHGPVGKTKYKDLMTGPNESTGINEQRKEAAITPRNQAYLASPVIRKMQKEMLDATDRLMKEQFGEAYDIVLHDKFLEFFNEKVYDPEGAFENLRNWIVDESDWSNEIKKNLVQGIRNKTCHKKSVNKVNVYISDSIEARSDLVTRPIDNRQFGFILNPDQDINDSDRLATPMQGDAMYGLGAVNAARGEALREVAVQLYNKGKAELEAEIAAMVVDVADRNKTTKLLAYLSKKGENIVKAMNNVENSAELISDERISQELPQVMEVLKRTYRKDINRIINAKMAGLRLNLCSSTTMPMYYKDGIPFSMEEVEGEIRSRPGQTILTAEKNYLDFDVVPEGYTLSQIAPMLKGEGITTPAEVIAPYPYRKQFGLNVNENINNVYTLNYKNGERENVRNLTPKQIADRMENAFAEGRMMKKDNIISREGDRWGGYEKYITAFDKSLDIIASRVPLHKPGSGMIARIIYFIDDGGNNLYLNPMGNVLSDADFDIDQDSTYWKKITEKDGYYQMPIDGSIEGLQNIGLEERMGFYKDPANQGFIFSKSTTAAYAKKADEKDATAKYKSDNHAASNLDIHNIMLDGADSIGIAINSYMAYLFMSQVSKSNSDILGDFKYLAGDYINMDENSRQRLWEGVIQAILDNPKSSILGRIGVSHSSISTLGAMITMNKTLDEIVDFFSLDVVRETFQQVNQGEMVQNSRADFDIFKMITALMPSVKTEEKVDSRGNVSQAIDITEAKTRLGEMITEATTDIKTFLQEDISKLDNESKYEKILNFYSRNKTSNDPAYKEFLKLTSSVGKDIINKKNAEALKQLKSYAYLSQAMFRLSRIQKIRNEMPVLDYDNEAYIREIEAYLGMSLDDFLSGKEISAKEHIDYYETHNNDYLRQGSNKEEATRLRDIEAEIVKQMNLPAVVRSFPNLVTFIKALRDTRNELNEVSWETHPIMQSVEKLFHQMQKQAWFPFKDQFYKMKNVKADILLDHFFKLFHSENSVNISVPVELDDGGHKKVLSIYDEVYLDSATGRQKFVNQFPSFHKFMRDVSNMSKDAGVQALIEYDNALTEEEAEKFFQALSGNDFIQNMTEDGREESSFVRMNDYNMSPARVAMYARSFIKLPKNVRDMYAFQQIIVTGFGYKKGSILDIIGKQVFGPDKGLTDAINRFKGYLNTINDDETEKNKFITRSVQYMLMQKEVAGYFSKKDEKNKYYPQAIMKNERRGARFFPQLYLYDETKKDLKFPYSAAWVVAPRGGFDMKNKFLSAIQYVALTPKQLNTLLLASGNHEIARVTSEYFAGHGYSGDLYYVNGAGQVMVIDSSTFSKVTWKTIPMTIEEAEEKMGVKRVASAEARAIEKDRIIELMTKRDDGTMTDEEMEEFISLGNADASMPEQDDYDSRSTRRTKDNNANIKC